MAPGPLLSLGLKSRELYPGWIRRLEALSGGVKTGYRECGVLRFGELGKLESICRWQRELGLNAELLGGRLLLPDEHQVDPPKLLRALAIAAANAGAVFRTGQVHGVGEHWVDVDAERLAADAVVVAAGSWSGLVAGARISPRMLQPMRGQMLELRLRLPPFHESRADDHVYLVSRGDGRVVCGSTMERAGFDKRVTAAGVSQILSRALALCPALEAAELHSTWAGLRPWTEDELPIIGSGPLPGLFLATGHFRNGILLAPVTATLISQALHGEATIVDINPFRYSRFPS